MNRFERGFGAPVCYTVARLALAAVFVYSGIDKLLHFSDAVAEVSGFGLQPAQVLAAITLLAQLLGAALLIAGGRAAIYGALLLAGFTAAVTLLVHRFWLLDGIERVRSLSTFLEHVGLVGAFVLVAHHQAGLRRDPRAD